MAVGIILAADVFLTFLLTNLVGPASYKPAAAPCAFARYGLPGLLFRTPFYLLRFYIGIAALLLRHEQKNWLLWGPAAGLALTAPLAFLSTLPDCPRSEPWANLVTGILQGAILAWLAVRLSKRQTKKF